MRVVALGEYLFRDHSDSAPSPQDRSWSLYGPRSSGGVAPVGSCRPPEGSARSCVGVRWRRYEPTWARTRSRTGTRPRHRGDPAGSNLVVGMAGSQGGRGRRPHCDSARVGSALLIGGVTGPRMGQRSGAGSPAPGTRDPQGAPHGKVAHQECPEKRFLLPSLARMGPGATARTRRLVTLPVTVRPSRR